MSSCMRVYCIAQTVDFEDETLLFKSGLCFLFGGLLMTFLIAAMSTVSPISAVTIGLCMS